MFSSRGDHEAQSSPLVGCYGGLAAKPLLAPADFVKSLLHHAHLPWLRKRRARLRTNLGSMVTRHARQGVATVGPSGTLITGVAPTLLRKFRHGLFRTAAHVRTHSQPYLAIASRNLAHLDPARIIHEDVISESVAFPPLGPTADPICRLPEPVDKRALTLCFLRLRVRCCVYMRLVLRV
eukprot:5425467-Amphidinium_carterae.2